MRLSSDVQSAWCTKPNARMNVCRNEINYRGFVEQSDNDVVEKLMYRIPWSSTTPGK